MTLLSGLDKIPSTVFADNNLNAFSLTWAHSAQDELLWLIIVWHPSVCPSMNNYLKNLLWNRLTDFNETSEKWSLGDALSKIWFPWGILATERKNFKILIVPNHKSWSFHIWHILASSIDPLPKYFKYGPGVEISPMLWGLGFHIETKKEIFKNLLLQERKG